MVPHLTNQAERIHPEDFINGRIKAMDEQMVENAWIEYEYWHKGARDDPDKFTREISRFETQIKSM